MWDLKPGKVLIEMTMMRRYLKRPKMGNEKG